jgi:hypothetical protein
MNYLLAVLVSALAVAFAAAVQAGEQQIVGWVEKVRLSPGNVLVEAKLDTGALHCSLDADNLTYFTRDGVQWVRFQVEDHLGQKATLARPLVGEANIKRHFLKYQKRPVVRLGVCLGSFYREVDVNLVDRSGFQYPMLIGRDFMRGALLIDPKGKHTVEPDCRGQQKLE